jgi:hypothetical protein
MSHIDVEELEEAVHSFYKKLLIADNYKPESKFGGKAILIKALKNAFSEILGEDYSLSQVIFNKLFYLQGPPKVTGR